MDTGEEAKLENSEETKTNTTASTTETICSIVWCLVAPVDVTILSIDGKAPEQKNAYAMAKLFMTCGDTSKNNHLQGVQNFCDAWGLGELFSAADAVDHHDVFRFVHQNIERTEGGSQHEWLAGIIPRFGSSHELEKMTQEELHWDHLESSACRACIMLLCCCVVVLRACSLLFRDIVPCIPGVRHATVAERRFDA